MREHRRIRPWQSSTLAKSPNSSPANKKLAEAIAERRRQQKQLAQQYEARRAEAAAWARNRRAALLAADRAKLEAQGITFDPVTGEPVLPIKQGGNPDNPS